MSESTTNLVHPVYYHCDDHQTVRHASTGVRAYNVHMMYRQTMLLFGAGAGYCEDSRGANGVI